MTQVKNVYIQHVMIALIKIYLEYSCINRQSTKVYLQIIEDVAIRDISYLTYLYLTFGLGQANNR